MSWRIIIGSEPRTERTFLRVRQQHLKLFQSYQSVIITNILFIVRSVNALSCLVLTNISFVWAFPWGLTRFLGSLKISLFEERRLEDTQNLKFEDRRFQNCLVLKTEDSATKPAKPEDLNSEMGRSNS